MCDSELGQAALQAALVLSPIEVRVHQHLIGVGDRVVCFLDPGWTRELALQERGFRALVESTAPAISLAVVPGTEPRKLPVTMVLNTWAATLS